MKKIFLVAALAVFTSSAFAQLLTGKSASLAKEESRNWSYLYLQYNAGTFNGDVSSKYLTLDGTYNGFSFGYNMDFRLTDAIPLFLETGIAGQISLSEIDFPLGGKADFTMLSAKIPLGVSYVFDIPNTPISIIPNAGFDFRINALAQLDFDGAGDIDLFDKEDMLGSDNTWDRFQVGAHIGANVRFWKKLLLGVNYQFDFNEIGPDTSLGQVNLTVGLCF